MKKRFLSVVLIGVLSASLCACGGNKTKVVDSSKVETSETKEKVTETAETEHEYTDEEIRELTIDYFINKVKPEKIAEMARKFYALSLMDTLKARQVKVTDSDLPFLADDFRFIACSVPTQGLDAYTFNHSDDIGLLDTRVKECWLSPEPNEDGLFVGDCVLEIDEGDVNKRTVMSTSTTVVAYTLAYDISSKSLEFKTIEDRGKGKREKYAWEGNGLLDSFLTAESPLLGEYTSKEVGKEEKLCILYDNGLILDGEIYLGEASDGFKKIFSNMGLSDFFEFKDGSFLYYINLSECEVIKEPAVDALGSSVNATYLYTKNDMNYEISFSYLTNESRIREVSIWRQGTQGTAKLAFQLSSLEQSDY